MIPDVSARSTRVAGDFLSENANADSFGRAAGQGMEMVGNAVSKLTDTVITKIKNDRSQAVAAGVAQSDFGPTLQKIRSGMDPSGAGYHDQVANAYDAYVDQNASKFGDGESQREYKQRMMAQRPGLLSDASSYEATRHAEYSTTQANSALDTLTNRLSNDPGNFDNIWNQGNAVIDARPDINPTAKAAMKQAWTNQAAFNVFQGRMNAATSPADLDKMAADLADQKQGWQGRFDPAQYQQTLNQIGAAKNSFNTLATTQANAAIDSLNARNDGQTLIPQPELDAASSLVRQSNNPLVQVKMARIQRDQQIIRETKGLPPSQIRAQNNVANVNPGAAYPGMPQPVSDAINNASSRFGVSASFLGGTVQKEYGGNLTVPKSAASPRFAPQTVNKNVDLSDVKPEVLDAATQAGELYGAPLQIYSGYRSQGHQDAIRNAPGMDPNRPGVAKHSEHTKGDALDISTAGMDDAAKGKLTNALVNSGFTGIGEYDTHIHADMRTTVPNSYGEQNGKAWGGWTYLTPEVAAALNAHGFKSGATSNDIVRTHGVPTPASTIDYGKGNGASSAVGVGQFTSSTWLGIMKDGSTAQRMGVDISGMSDAQILDMRKDPNVSVMMTAAYAEKNKTTMEQSLGRPVNDGELYLAHFLGSSGAIQLIQAVKNDPTADASKLMPQAAAANHNVFFEKTKGHAGGRALTAQEVYDNVTLNFATDQTQVAYGDNETRTKIANANEKSLKDDPIKFVSDQGTQTVAPLSDDPASFVARGKTALSTADYYSIPIHDMKPFTDDEANSLVKAMDSGTADDTMSVMSHVAAMGGDMAKQGFAQLGEKDPSIGFAAGLAYGGGNVAAARQIVQGEKVVKDNPGAKASLGDSIDTKVSQAFSSSVGQALNGMNPAERQAAQEAALSYYMGDTNNVGAPFDPNKFDDAVQTVLGGSPKAPIVDSVNGQATVLPQGITGDTMNTALDKMTDNDWVTMSLQKAPPMSVTGERLDASTLADEAKLEFIGAGQYRVKLADNGYAVVAPDQPYIFTPDAKTVSSIAARPDPIPYGYPDPNAPRSNVNVVQPSGSTNTMFQFMYDENGRYAKP